MVSPNVVEPFGYAAAPCRRFYGRFTRRRAAGPV